MSSQAEIKLSIENMKCSGCVSAVEKALESVAGVETVDVSLDNKSATIVADCLPEDLVRVVTEAGYPAKVVNA